MPVKPGASPQQGSLSAEGIRVLPLGSDLGPALREATQLLEKVAGDRGLLAQLTVEERTRLMTAAGEIYCPDVSERRRLVKARIRQRKAEKRERAQTQLNEVRIRKLRKEKVFTTPNVFPP